ncbi:hypothetical protein PUG81_05180 [Erwiniaceae bacterium L1_54_6]|nr:hypothetical protein [Erwiniaceae bacterium L1_54_6]
MAKSIHKRFIRAWQLSFRHVCDSKVSAHWRKSYVKGFLRESGIISADGLIHEIAEDLAHADYPGEKRSYTPEFSRWFNQPHRFNHYFNLATIKAIETSDEEIEDLINEEISNWGN